MSMPAISPYVDPEFGDRPSYEPQNSMKEELEQAQQQEDSIMSGLYEGEYNEGEGVLVGNEDER